MTTYAGFRPPVDRRCWPGRRDASPLVTLARSIAGAGRCVCPVLVAAGRDGVVPTPARPNRLGRPGIGVSSACAGCGGAVMEGEW